MLLNPIDPEAENFIGAASIDTDGDGIGQWEDVDEIRALEPADGSILATVSPTFTLTQFNPAVVTRYRFQVATEPEFGPGSVVWDRSDASSNSVTLPLGYLENHRLYYWRAMAFDGTEWSTDWSEVRSFAVHIQVADVGGLRLSRGVEEGPFELSWNADPSAVAYHLEIAKTQTFSENEVVLRFTELGTASLQLDAVLESAVTYYWRVRSEQPGEVLGEWSTVSSFTVESGTMPIDAATPTDGGVVATRTPTLSWPSVDGAVSYELQVSETPDFANLAVPAATGLTAPAHTIPAELHADALYHWKVRAKGTDSVWGPWSPTWRFTVDLSSVEAVSPAANAVFPPGSGVLRWTDPWPDHPAPTRYAVEVAKNTDFARVVLSIEVDRTSLDLNGYLSEDAPYYWRVAAVDETGQRGGYSEPRAFTLDSSAAALAEMDGPTATNDATPRWTWTLPDLATGVRYKLDSAADWEIPANPAATSYEPETELPDGTYTLLLQAQAGDGAWSSTVAHTTKIDTAAPAAPLVSGPEFAAEPRPRWTIDSTEAPDGTATPLRYRHDGMAPDTWNTLEVLLPFSYVPGENLENGVYTLTAYVGDAAGNWSEAASHTITVDYEAPNRPVVTGPEVSIDPRPTWTVTVPADSVETRYQIGGPQPELWVSADANLSEITPAEDLAEGTHTMFVQSRDSAGNWSETGSHALTVDRPAPPAPTVAAADPPLTTDSTPTWTVSTSVVNPAALRYQLNGTQPDGWITVTPRGTSSFTPGNELLDGEHVLYAQVADVDGNWSSIASYALTVDCTPPTALEVSAPEETWKPRPTWTWYLPEGADPTDIHEVRYELQSEAEAGAWFFTTPNYQGSHTPTAPLPQGQSTFSVQARDEAGNWSELAEFTTVIDSTTITLEWDHSENWQEDGVVGYRLYSWESTGWERRGAEVLAEPGTPSITLRGLTIGETYEFMVTAYTDTLESGYDETLTYIPGETNE